MGESQKNARILCVYGKSVRISSRLIHTPWAVLSAGLALILHQFGWTLPESTLSDGIISRIFETLWGDLA